MTARALIVVLLLTSLLVACGVRGKPEAPEGEKRTNEPIVLDPLIN
jgi:predicted small lipoprotein YifL